MKDLCTCELLQPFKPENFKCFHSLQNGVYCGQTTKPFYSVLANKGRGLDTCDENHTEMSTYVFQSWPICKLKYQYPETEAISLYKEE